MRNGIRILCFLALMGSAQASRDFDASSYIRGSTAPVSAPPFTVACFFRLDDLAATYAVLSISNSSGAFQGHRILAEGSTSGSPLRIDTAATGTGFARSSTSMSAGTWHHAAGVWASVSSRTVYLDGSGGVTDTMNVGTPTVDIIDIGTRQNSGTPGLFFSGQIAELSVWNVALTQPEVVALAAGFPPMAVRPSAAVFYAPLWLDIFDYIGRVTLTNNGTTAADTNPRIYR